MKLWWCSIFFLAMQCGNGDLWESLKTPGESAVAAKAPDLRQITLKTENFTGNFDISDGTDTVTISSTGTVILPRQYQPDESYSLSIVSQPAGSRCELQTGSGIFSGQVEIAVFCGYTVSGQVFGEDPTGLSLKIEWSQNESETVQPTSLGAFSFSRPVIGGYNISVVSQPSAGSTCHLNPETGTIASDFSAISVSCITPTLNGLNNIGYWVMGSAGFGFDALSIVGPSLRIDSPAANDGLIVAIPGIKPSYARLYFRGEVGGTCSFQLGDAWWDFNTGAALRVRTNATDILPDHAASATYTTGVWHTAEFKNINWISQSADVYLDGVMKGSVNFNMYSVDFSRVVLYNETPGTSCYFDELLFE